MLLFKGSELGFNGVGMAPWKWLKLSHIPFFQVRYSTSWTHNFRHHTCKLVPSTMQLAIQFEKWPTTHPLWVRYSIHNHRKWKEVKCTLHWLMNKKRAIHWHNQLTSRLIISFVSTKYMINWKTKIHIPCVLCWKRWWQYILGWHSYDLIKVLVFLWELIKW